MLNIRNFELDYLRELQEKYRKDPVLLERVLYAFGLLEALSIISRGSIDSQDYAEYIKGIRSVDTHILAMNYSGEVAMCQACQVVYFTTCLLKGKEYIKIEKPENYIDCNIADKKYKGLNKMKKQKLEAYAYLYEAVQLLEEYQDNKCQRRGTEHSLQYD